MSEATSITSAFDERGCGTNPVGAFLFGTRSALTFPDLSTTGGPFTPNDENRPLVPQHRTANERAVDASERWARPMAALSIRGSVLAVAPRASAAESASVFSEQPRACRARYAVVWGGSPEPSGASRPRSPGAGAPARPWTAAPHCPSQTDRLFLAQLRKRMPAAERYRRRLALSLRSGVTERGPIQ
jgi:hypothetical protein